MTDEFVSLWIIRLAKWAKLASYVTAIGACIGGALYVLRPASAALTWDLVSPAALAQTVAVVEPVKADVDKLRTADQKLDTRLLVVERSALRTEVMVEMLLKDREIRPPPRTDAGIP